MEIGTRRISRCLWTTSQRKKTITGYNKHLVISEWLRMPLFHGREVSVLAISLDLSGLVVLYRRVWQFLN
ncbi:hypothetical protein RHGRI_022921 [Rhododendron griersonianum]|uniref:Uncharacterized protein n=1 Tax=Rhododendron griersonianum TaxID=479676 RepID=A0AAV6J3M6_9ERIC|nr:hypothetical protein RHGRI_022921 [Rhododendron griersonianum]